MNFLVLCLLCLVQGLTEFLPISSSGHLLLIENLFGINGEILTLNLFLHLATLFAVVIYFRKTILKIIKKPFQPLTYKLVLTTLITAIIAFAYKFLGLEPYANNFYGMFFILTAIILYLNFVFQKKSAVVSSGEINYKSAIIVGFVQGLAVLPGISRSGSTISALTFCGNDEENSAEYSFLISIPIIVGGFIIELLSSTKATNVFASLSVFECLFAFALTFLVSLLSLKVTVKMLKKNKFIYFSIYLLVIGVVSLIISFC